MKLREACAQKVGISVEQGVKVYHGDFTINDEKSQCFIACLLEKSGYLNEQGEPNPDEVITKLLAAKHVTNVSLVIVFFSPKFDWHLIYNNFKVDEVLSTCRGERGANACESAFNFYQCYYKTRVVAPKTQTA